MTETNPKGFFSRLKQGLNRTSQSMGNMFLGEKEISDELVEDIETMLLTADVGVDATTLLMDNLKRKIGRKELGNVDAVKQALKQSMVELLTPCEGELNFADADKTFAILVVGINGAGKTTTIGKIAKIYTQQGKRVFLAAGDTFRAAAVEQLIAWGERNDVNVVSQGSGADSAAVVFDALQSAHARGADLLLADTAGRLHTQDNLMDELKKIKRVMSKLDENAPHETLLVVDGGTGQNAIQQAQAFHDAIGLTGLAITKLDGTAKGGVLFAMSAQLKLPIRFIGVGEAIDDLRPFVAEEFVNALLDTA